MTGEMYSWGREVSVGRGGGKILDYMTAERLKVSKTDSGEGGIGWVNEKRADSVVNTLIVELCQRCCVKHRKR